MCEKNHIEDYIRSAAEGVSQLDPGEAAPVLDTLLEVLRGGGKILVCGNGGSAADGSHFAGELVGRFRLERRGIPAVSLSSDTAVLTALGNDYGFDRVFQRQVEAMGAPGDALLALTTSGASPNIVKAAEKACEMGMRVIALTSASCMNAPWAHIHWRAPSRETSHAQEQMMIVLHGVCLGLEALLAKNA